MTQYIPLVLALCVGQVPNSTTSPYAATGTVSEVQSPAYSAGQPQEKALRTPFWSRFFLHQEKKTCVVRATKGRAKTYYVVAAPAPVAPATTVHVEYSGRYFAMPSTPANAQIAAAPAVWSSHEESEAAPFQQKESVPVTTAGEPAADLKIDKKYESKIGHEQDYGWITGHLFYVHTDGGKWVVRYAMPGEIDKFGGSVVLAPGVEMKNYREGDLVCVYGEVLDEGRASKMLGGALYRVNSILMIERSDP